MSGVASRIGVARIATDAPLLSAVTLVMAALIPVTLFAMAIEERALDGANLWLKPLKFEISLAVYVGTLAIFARWMPDHARRALWFRAYVWVAAICIALEMIWIGGAAAAGVRSHFNTGPMMSAIYGAMGVFAVTLTSLTVAMAVPIARNAALTPRLRDGLVLGLVLTFVLTVITAGTMSGQGRLVGDGSASGVWPFFGWSTETGDLRAAHFFATHAMHAVPLAALGALALGLGRRAVWGAAAAYTLLTALLYGEAMSGRPPFSLFL